MKLKWDTFLQVDLETSAVDFTRGKLHSYQGKGLAMALVSIGDSSAYTDSLGRFVVSNVASAAIRWK
ncbi:MAG: hypothetical protein IT292_03985 [Deltaproteobacteria bacterium]|nr:hypothetical protein [Deltaproteobacteria bacterium]